MARTMTVLLALVLAQGCSDRTEKIKEAQRRRTAEKERFEKEKEERQKAANPKIQRAELEPFWGDPAYARIITGKPCPEGLWALFDEVPGEGEEREKNLASKADAERAAREKTYYALLPLGGGVTPLKYNPRKKVLPVEVEGLVECFDKAGLVSVAWGTPARAFRPRNPEEEGLTPQAVWRARPVVLNVPFKNAAEARRFTEGDGVTLEARVVFTLGKTQVDRKMLKTPRYLEDGTEIVNMVDWGAGRLINVSLLGIRLATGHEHSLVAEKRTGGSAAAAAR